MVGLRLLLPKRGAARPLIHSLRGSWRVARYRSLIFGCILRCLDPMLTGAAVLTARTVFVSPQDRLAEAKAYG